MPYVTESGYLRGRYNGRRRMVHDWIWERARGPIPPGHCIHHRNGVRADNRLSNLALVTHTEHKRIHSGCYRRSGVWYKPCSECGRFKAVTAEHWELTPEGWPYRGRCRVCRAEQRREGRAAAHAVGVLG